MEQSYARTDDLLYGIYDRPQNPVGHHFVGVSCQAFCQRLSPSNSQLGIDVDDVDSSRDCFAKAFIFRP
jgi:hypothetical protein